MGPVIRNTGMSQRTQEVWQLLSIMRTAIETNRIATRQTRKVIEESRTFLKQARIDGTT